MACEILVAGFGGQGVLFAGRFLANEALLRGKEVSWLPSYGPEMRGGTANCSVIVSDNPIGSPIISEPDILIALNLPSLDKYEDTVKKDGIIIVDSSLIERKVKRNDVSAYYIPATKLASDNELSGLANMIVLGFLVKVSGLIPYDNIKNTMTEIISAKKQNLFSFNLKAIELGYNYSND